MVLKKICSVDGWWIPGDCRRMFVGGAQRVLDARR
jgi:hypothetical protein